MALAQNKPRGKSGQSGFFVGKYGQLGHKDTASWDRPCRVEYFVDKQLHVMAVSCGPWNTYVYAVEKEKS